MTEPGDLAPSLYVPLPKAPSAFSLTVRKLIGRVAEGGVRVPPFQRPLRWHASDVVKLFDSIVRGYPIGSLLFWKRALAADPALVVGNAEVAVPATADGWFIVDGQQRTTALAAALLDLDHRGDRRWGVWFDPHSNTFSSEPPTPGEARRRVPLRALGDLRRLSHWLREADLNEVEAARVEDVQQRILDYELPCTLVDTEDASALKGAFARLNGTGVRMRADEVFQALLGERSSDASRRHVDLAELQRAADIDGFGEPPRGEVLKALLAASGLDPSKRLEDLGDGATSKVVGAADAAEAIRRAVGFLQAAPLADAPGAGIRANALLPYPVAFVLLARFFHLFPEPDAASRRALAQWVWRGVATGVHQRAEVSPMRFQVRAMREGDLAGSLARLAATVGEPSPREWTLGRFNGKSASSRVETLALLDRHPRDREGEVSWRALLSSGERVAREVFRVDRFEGDRELSDLARTAANRVLLDVRHSSLAPELRTWVAAGDRDVLETHLIDARGFEALLADDAATFLRHRASRVRVAVTTFLGQRTGLGGPRLLPVESYLDADEASP